MTQRCRSRPSNNRNDSETAMRTILALLCEATNRNAYSCVQSQEKS